MGERSPYKAEVTGSKPVPPMWLRWGGSSARLERLPVTQEAAGSSPVHPVNIFKGFQSFTPVIVS